MTYRVYSGPPGTETVPPMEKERWLYKEFGLLDEAFGWARHVNEREISAALRHPEEGERIPKAKAKL